MTAYSYGTGVLPNLPALFNSFLMTGHNVLNAHAAAVDLYRRKYQPIHKGRMIRYALVSCCDQWRYVVKYFERFSSLLLRSLEQHIN